MWWHEGCDRWICPVGPLHGVPICELCRTTGHIAHLHGATLVEDGRELF